MNPSNVLQRLIQLMENHCGSLVTEISYEEEQLAVSLQEIILQCMENGQSSVETVTNLVFDSFCGIDETLIYNENDDPECEMMDADDNDVEDQTSSLTKEKKNEILDYWNGCKGGGRRKWSSMKTRYRFLTNVQQLYRWERQRHRIARGEKYQIIAEHTLERFKNAVTNHQFVHDRDLRKWALDKSKEIDCTGFKASKHWLHTFKTKYRIVSRKITKFVTKANVKGQEDIENAAIAFQLENAPLVEQIGRPNCFNADQSGFQLEMHGGRSLDFKGVKKVEIIAQSKNALTHSYTIMPMMSASGRLVGPLYIVLQEPNGKFGPLVEQTMSRPKNVVISASRSGKMETRHLHEWVTKVLVPFTGDDTLLMIDSWSIFTEENIRTMIPEHKRLSIKQIPPGATGLIQQWDIFGFRFWKNMARHISDHIMLHELPISLFQRDNIIKLQALIYHQLSSPRYEALFQYSWYKSGLVETRPPVFPNPVKFGFDDSDMECGLCVGCTAMIRCSWCKTPLCAHHSLTLCHDCDTYVP